MAYTNTWNESVPSGGAPANTIDDVARALKQDIRERWNSMLGYAIGTALSDPVIPAGKGMMESRTYKVWMPWSQASYVSAASTLTAPASDGTSSVGIDVVANTHTTGYFHMPLRLPVGATIAISSGATPGNHYIDYSQSGGTLVYDIKAYKRLYTATVGTAFMTGSGSGALTGHLYAGFGPSSPETIVDDTEYSLAFYFTPSAGTTTTIFGVAISITLPDYTVR